MNKINKIDRRLEVTVEELQEERKKYENKMHHAEDVGNRIREAYNQGKVDLINHILGIDENNISSDV